MADINSSSTGGNGRRKGQLSRMNLRVDFTPMVDMNMLLITFFMFCTTLSKPQVMDIVMPTKQTDEAGGNTIPESKTTTLLLGADHQIYYYQGKPDYNNPFTLSQTNPSSTGLRNVLLAKNSEVIQQVQDLKVKRAGKQISQEQFKEKMSELKKSKEGQIVVIKPTDQSTYSDLVNTLDEMEICAIGRYAIVELDDGDHFLLDNTSDDRQLAQARTR